MNFLELARARYSVRSFSGEKVKPEHLDYILEAGRCANSAKNLQPQEILVVQSEEKLEAVNRVYRTFGAGTVLVCCGRRDVAWTNPFSGWNSAETDVAICVSHMMLAAAEIGVGSTWICYFDPEKLRAELGLDESLTPFCLLPLGYADQSEASAPSLRHSERKELSQTVKYI